MGGFTLDTSGAVGPISGDRWTPALVYWTNLTPVAQGYVEALIHSVGATRFSDLSPEALALILRDCEAFYGGEVKPLPGSVNRATSADGKLFWLLRQDDCYPVKFPPLTPYLSADGKVCLREGQ